MMTDDKTKMLENAISQIEKDYGKGAIMRLGSRDVLVPVSVIPTGALSIDAALGVGGVPRGRVIEIYGPESGGKTTLTLHIIAEAQKLGGQAAFIDAEHALDPVYARKLGVDVDNLLVSQPDNGEQALEIAQKLIQSNAVDVIVVDSVAALVPRAELEGEMGEPQMGLQARLMSQALRKLTAIVSKSRTCLIFINQIREKIGVMFGNPETTTGGRALKFYSSIRLDIRRIQSIKEGDRVIGSRTRAKVVKNKVAAPFREAEFDILYGEGVSREGDLIDLGVDKGILEKSGTWISFGGERLGQGRENARVFLKEHTDVRGKIENALRKKMGIPIPGAANGSANGSGAQAGQPEKSAEKPAVQAAAAAASASANKPRPVK
jgi:recombination protein RecA